MIRRIFDLYLSGLSFYKVAIKLNEEGYKSYTGKPFCGDVVAQIVRNEKYTGNSLLQKYYVDDKGERKMVKNKGELPMYFSENTHPAIISQETFGFSCVTLEEELSDPKLVNKFCRKIGNLVSIVLILWYT